MASLSDVLRQLSFDALRAANTIAGDQIYSPGDWPTDDSNMPAILVNCNKEMAESGSRAQANFTVTAMIEFDAKVLANSGEKARADLVLLCDQIKDAIFTNATIMAQLQQFASYQVTRQYNSDSGKHIGYAKIEIGMEYFEVPETPVNPKPLESIGLHVDLGNVFDPNHTYANPPFPAAVVPAPRTHGPDGRDEGGGVINLPQ